MTQKIFTVTVDRRQLTLEVFMKRATEKIAKRGFGMCVVVSSVTLRELEWQEGDEVNVDVVGDTMVVSKKPAQMPSPVHTLKTLQYVARETGRSVERVAAMPYENILNWLADDRCTNNTSAAEQGLPALYDLKV